jgi:hypothetical protein
MQNVKCSTADKMMHMPTQKLNLPCSSARRASRTSSVTAAELKRSDPEFHAEEQRHEHHAAGVALGHVLAQLLPVLHRPGQVPSPDTEMIDRNEELSGFQKTEQGYPGLRRIVAPVIDAARALLQRKRLVRHVEELTVRGRPFESRWKRFSCLV